MTSEFLRQPLHLHVIMSKRHSGFCHSSHSPRHVSLNSLPARQGVSPNGDTFVIHSFYIAAVGWLFMELKIHTLSGCHGIVVLVMGLSLFLITVVYTPAFCVLWQFWNHCCEFSFIID